MSDIEEALAWQIRMAKLPEPQRQYKFSPDRRYRADFAWPDHRLLVECEGGSWVNGRHSRGSGFEKDCVRSCLAAILGWRIMRVTGAMVADGRAFGLIEKALKG